MSIYLVWSFALLLYSSRLEAVILWLDICYPVKYSRILFFVFVFQMLWVIELLLLVFLCWLYGVWLWYTLYTVWSVDQCTLNTVQIPKMPHPQIIIIIFFFQPILLHVNMCVRAGYVILLLLSTVRSHRRITFDFQCIQHCKHCVCVVWLKIKNIPNFYRNEKSICIDNNNSCIRFTGSLSSMHSGWLASHWSLWEH